MINNVNIWSYLITDEGNNMVKFMNGLLLDIVTNPHCPCVLQNIHKAQSLSLELDKKDVPVPVRNNSQK